MAHGSLREFDPIKESIEDFIERFELYCLANNFRGEGDHARCKNALFITLLGQKTYVKLKILSSPTSVADLTLDDITEQPVAYVSRSLQSSEQKYAQIEHEALGIIFAVRRFHQYLYGRSFMLVTDH